MTTTVLPPIHQALQHAEELADVVEVQARSSARRGGRAVRPVARCDSSFDELDPLRLAAGQGRRRLAEADVAQADVLQRLELLADRRHRPRRTRAPDATVISSTSAIDFPL